MAIELHTWGTPNGRKISVALEEMGLPYTVHPINISKGEQFSPAFLKISPNNRIPAIVDPDGPGGKPISVFESGAILIYLGEKTGKDEADRKYGLERYSKETHRLYGVFDKRLAEAPYAGGSEVSIADFAILGWAWRHERHQVDLKDYPNVKRWYEALMARPATKRGMEISLGN
jgi:GST-like protein